MHLKDKMKGKKMLIHSDSQLIVSMTGWKIITAKKGRLSWNQEQTDKNLGDLKKDSKNKSGNHWQSPDRVLSVLFKGRD